MGKANFGLPAINLPKSFNQPQAAQDLYGSHKVLLTDAVIEESALHALRKPVLKDRKLAIFGLSEELRLFFGGSTEAMFSLRSLSIRWEATCTASFQLIHPQETLADDMLFLTRHLSQGVVSLLLQALTRATCLAENVPGTETMHLQDQGQEILVDFPETSFFASFLQTCPLADQCVFQLVEGVNLGEVSIADLFSPGTIVFDHAGITWHVTPTPLFQKVICTLF